MQFFPMPTAAAARGKNTGRAFAPIAGDAPLREAKGGAASASADLELKNSFRELLGQILPASPKKERGSAPGRASHREPFVRNSAEKLAGQGTARTGRLAPHAPHATQGRGR